MAILALLGLAFLLFLAGAEIDLDRLRGPPADRPTGVPVSCGHVLAPVGSRRWAASPAR